MNTNQTVGLGNGVAAIAPAKPDPKRAATTADAVDLGLIYSRLSTASKRLTKAKADYAKALAVLATGAAANAAVNDLGEELENAANAYRIALLHERQNIASLPLNTTAKGGANCQTVVFEFYGAVNRELGKRLTASEARRLNAAAFGG